MSDIVTKDRVVRRLAADHDWANPVNRAISYIAESLLANGVASHVVYDAIAAVPVER